MTKAAIALHVEDYFSTPLDVAAAGSKKLFHSGGCICRYSAHLQIDEPKNDFAKWTDLVELCTLLMGRRERPLLQLAGIIFTDLFSVFPEDELGTRTRRIGPLFEIHYWQS